MKMKKWNKIYCFKFWYSTTELVILKVYNVKLSFDIWLVLCIIVSKGCAMYYIAKQLILSLIILLAMLCLYANNYPFKKNGFTRSWTTNCLKVWYYIRNKPATE